MTPGDGRDGGQGSGRGSGRGDVDGAGRTAEFRHGLIVGKFYPPHAGHHHLIETAAERCERLSVIVAASSAESIPLADRAGWLREAHPRPEVEIIPAVDDIEIDYDSDEIWSAHVEVFRGALRAAYGAARTQSGTESGTAGVAEVDAVFSSEAYGPELARRFGAAHVAVDPGRARFPVSGTAVRADPVAYWHQLSPPVRAHLCHRVAVVGAESTGTTTLARALAARYAARGGPWSATRWVPVYGRTYCEEKLALARRADPGLWVGDLPWTSGEFTVIAERHLALTEAAARAGSPLLVCDTDALATVLWHERYLGAPAPEVEAVHRRSRHDLWILTDPGGVPFEQDGWRDGEQIRPAMAARFAAELDRRGLPHVTVTGSPEDRLSQAAEAVDKLIAAGRRFSDPL